MNSTPEPVYILGAGMHPWGKWGNDFTEYGVVAARAALAEAGLDWRQIQLVAGADTIRNGYPGFVAGATFAQKLGWNGVPVSSSYAACASGSQALQSARAQILAGFCDVALVIGADTTPKGFFAPVGGERKNDPDWQRFHLIGATNTVYFALLARRRMDLYGATLEDFAQVKVKNSKHGLNNPNARYRKENSIEDVLASPVVSDPLRLLDICATSDGAAALIVASADFTRKHLGSLEGVPSVRAVSTVTPQYPQHLPELPDIATDSTAVVAAPDRVFKDQIIDAAYAEAGIGPEDLSLAEVYDLSTALELDWYEHLGLCPKGEAETLLRSGATTIGGKIPVNPSGGLACFGEAIPAQAISQVCELAWQLRGQATGRQVEGAKAGITANQGLFGHGSSVIVAR
jgi:acetyl-CoA acetyltransferase